MRSYESRAGVWITATALIAAGLAACSSSGSSHAKTPQGLTGQQAGSIANSEFSVEDRQAATVLAPAAGTFLSGKTIVTVLGSTTPANGDENPYALWPVTRTGGSLTAGDVLVDNFNNKSNKQGTGTTIVDVHPSGKTSVFAALPRTVAGCPGGVGLTTAMVQLKTGWVIVGSLPSTDGKTDSAGRGCLLVLSPSGTLAETLSGAYLDGPWDATVHDTGASASLFVTNTLVGLAHSATAKASHGDVVRLALTQSVSRPPKVTAETTIARGIAEAGDPSSFVKGPTGLALAANGTLYIADNLGNRILSVTDALTRTSPVTGTVVTSGGQLAHPLGMALTPSGDLLVANGVNGKIVEITQSGRQVGEYYAIQDVGQDPPGNGDLFGIAIDQAGTGVLFVKDDVNALALLHS